MRASATLRLAQLVAITATLGCEYSTSTPNAGDSPPVQVESRPSPAFTMPQPQRVIFPADTDRLFTGGDKPDEPIEPAAPEIRGPREWAGTDVRWMVPIGWVQVTGTGMRFATLKQAGEDGFEVAVTRIAGAAGGPIANINRWRSSLGLPPIEEDKLNEHISQYEHGALKGARVDMTSADALKRLVVISVPFSGETWFFKISGSSTSVEHNIQLFRAFVDSVQFDLE